MSFVRVNGVLLHREVHEALAATLPHPLLRDPEPVEPSAFFGEIPVYADARLQRGTIQFWRESPAELERLAREGHDPGDEQPPNVLREETSAAMQRWIAGRKWR